MNGLVAMLSVQTLTLQVVMDAEKEAQARATLIQGTRCENADDWLGAIANYEKVLSLAPRHVFTRYFGHNNLAYSLIQVGRFSEAAWHAEQAIKVDAVRHNAHKNLGLALQGLGRYPEAAMSLVTAARLEPHDPRALMHLRALLETYPELVNDMPELRNALDELGGGNAVIFH
jgi:Flp pilus assembly protein TadD